MRASQRVRAVTCFAVLAALGAGPVTGQRSVLGEVVDVQERVEFSLRGAALQELQRRAPLVREMRVVTFTGSKALMAYDHPRAMLYMGPQTEFLVRPPAAIDDYRCPELLDSLADLELARGELRFVRERSRTACSLRLLTRAAVILVLGTDLRVRVDPADGTTVVSVAEGSVEVYRRDPATGEPVGRAVHLEAGEVSVVAPGRAPSLPAPRDPGTSLLSPGTDAPPLSEPLGAPFAPDLDDLLTLCNSNRPPAICRVLFPELCL